MVIKDYTIKEISDILGRSKSTVEKRIKKEHIQEAYTRGNRKYFSAETTAKIIEMLSPGAENRGINRGINTEITEKSRNKTADTTTPTAETGAKTTPTAENNAEITEKSTENAEIGAEHSKTVELLAKTVELLEAELKQKDKQINDLNNRLAEALKLTAQQQYLTVTEKQPELLEETAPSQKQSLFKRLFNKK